MGNSRNRYPARRRFLKQTAALSAGAAALATPAIVLGAGRKASAGGAPAGPPSSSASDAPSSSNAAVAPSSVDAQAQAQAGASQGTQRDDAEAQSPRKP